MKCHNTYGIIKITVLGNSIYEAKLMLSQFFEVLVYIKKHFTAPK